MKSNKDLGRLLRKLNDFLKFRYIKKSLIPIHISRSELKAFLLTSSSGVLHIGAHHGQEAEDYESRGKSVLWIEAIPEHFSKLNQNISRYPDQLALNALISNKNGELVEFHITNNDGESSSMFKLAEDNGFPDLKTTSTVLYSTVTIDSLRTSYDLKIYSHWVIDVQGAELLVLLGAQESIKWANSIEIECSSREIYRGGADFKDIDVLLEKYGFRPAWNLPKNSHEDVIYLRC